MMFYLPTSASTTVLWPSPVQFAVTIDLPGGGGSATLVFTAIEMERFKRGVAMWGGQFRERIDQWDAMTAQEREQYEADADWLGRKIDRVKMARSISSSGSGTARPTGQPSQPNL